MMSGSDDKILFWAVKLWEVCENEFVFRKFGLWLWNDNDSRITGPEFLLHMAKEAERSVLGIQDNETPRYLFLNFHLASACQL